MDETVGRAIEGERGGGRALDPAARPGLESALGEDFSDVRVHTDAAADRLSRALAATAFTTGSDIFFRAGAYDPLGTAGQKLLAHELTHVVQQRGAASSAGELRVTDPGDPSEREAEAVADEVARFPAGALTARQTADEEYVSTSDLAEGASVSRQPRRLEGNGLRNRAAARSAIVQRALGVNNPLVAADVARVKKIGTKLVYILAGHGADSVVVKFEVPSARGLAELAARRDALYDLARTALEHVPEANALTPADLTALQQLDPQNVAGDVGDLVTKLQKGLAQATVPLKMERVDVGLSLEDMISQRAVTPSLLSSTVLRQLGKMAFFDLLVSNTDRFQPDGDLNVQNIDFMRTGNEVVPLDNLDPWGGGIPTTLTGWKGRKRIDSKSARKEYAADALATILAKTNGNVRVKDAPGLVAQFAAGMEDAAARCKHQEKRLEQVAFGPAANTPPGDVAEGLANRLRVIKV